MTQTQSSTWCSMVLDGYDDNGDEWNRCTVHDVLVFGDAYVCEGYEAPAYEPKPQIYRTFYAEPKEDE